MVKSYTKYWYIFIFGLLVVKATSPLLISALSSHIAGLIYTVAFSTFLFLGVQKHLIRSWIKSIKNLVAYAAVYILLATAFDVIIFISSASSPLPSEKSLYENALVIVFLSVAFHFFLLVIVNTMLFIYAIVSKYHTVTK